MTKKKIARPTVKKKKAVSAPGKKAAPKKALRKKAAAKKPAPSKTSGKWSSHVTGTSNALDLAPRIFRSKDPEKIAASLKRSAERSKRRKGTVLQSAMSMLNFYINRAGKNLSANEKQPLDKAKEALRDLFKKKK